MQMLLLLSLFRVMYDFEVTSEVLPLKVQQLLYFQIST